MNSRRTVRPTRIKNCLTSQNQWIIVVLLDYFGPGSVALKLKTKT